jgi:penicillin-binding protein 1B
MPPRGWTKARRPTAYQAPPPSRFRRCWDVVCNRWTASIAIFLVLAGFLTLTYFWFELSDRIDQRLLSGEVFTASAGIYSAPKTLRVGEATSMDALVEYLRSAGYIERDAQADESRSRYAVEGDVLAIQPGVTGTIDGRRVFPALSVKFSKDKKTVAAIGDRDSGVKADEAKLEPKLLSSIAAEGDGRRRTVKFQDLPQHLIKAITVTEDRTFFEHYGVNFRGIVRAAWRRYEGDEDSPLANQGGSSITQQLVKNLFLSREQTYTRKALEAYMSVILETRLTKEEIFTLYANQIYLGQQTGVSIYGVGEAANAYFGKDVTQLSMGEAALLAGIIRSPNRYNAFKNPDRVRERRNQVLDSMYEAGEITQGQRDAARAEPLQLKQISNTRDLQGMPYFSQYVTEQLPKLVTDPDALQHLRVYTSIDPDLQRAAYEVVNKRLAALDKYFPKKPRGTLNGALVAVRPKTGEIVAMVGGRDYLANQFNRATDAMRQPGSVFKPFVYAAAINSAYDSSSRQFTAATVLKDEKKTFTFGNETYSPKNYGDTFTNKETTLRDALVKSKNTITVDVAMQMNIGKIMNLAAKAGLPKVEKAYPSMALGTAEATPLQVATGYTMFANLGDRVMPMPITSITAGDGRVIQAPEPDRKNVMRSDVTYIMNDIMKDVIERGTGAEAKAWGFRNTPGKSAIAGKTGTSRDGWFAGFNPEIVCVVYVGFDDGDDLGMKGSDSAMPIWADFMQAALKIHPEWNGDWTMPAGVRKAEIDIRNGALVRELDGIEQTGQPDTSKIAGGEAVAALASQAGDVAQMGVPDVPAEFRRVELFIAGTVPNRSLLPPPPQDDDPGIPTPSPTPTALPRTWQEDAEMQGATSDNEQRSRGASTENRVIVYVCPVSKMRARSLCPDPEAKPFRAGSEPKEFCSVHR